MRGLVQPQCYYDALMYAVRSGRGTIVHGSVVGGSPKRRIKHAWVEFGDKVYDPQLDEELDRVHYYELMSARPSHRYSVEDAINRSFRSGIYGGPW